MRRMVLGAGISPLIYPRRSSGGGAANSGVGTDTPMMIAGGSYPAGIAYNWWGGADGLQGGTVGHGILTDTRGDYSGAITSSALGETLAGVGLACVIGPTNTSEWVWNRASGDWPEFCDPRNDMALYSGGAFILYEAEQMINDDWIVNEVTGHLAAPYIWRSNGHRITLPRDLEYEYRLVELAAQNSVTPYIGGHWPPMVINPPDDASWRTRFDGYDIALRYRREYLSAQLAANSLPSDVWIVPTHWIYARAYDDDQTGNLPAGISSHLDFHALEDGYSAENRGYHPYMPSKLAIYCARAMIYDVVEGQDALALPDNAAEGITGTVAAYLRQMAKDIVSDYAPAGRGGSSYADPAMLTATPARPSVVLANCVGEWVTGDASVTTIASANPVHFGACIIDLDDIATLPENEQVAVMQVSGAGSSRIIFEVLNPDWRPAPIIRVEVFDESGTYQQGTFIDAPTGGTHLIEWWINDQLTFRVVDLSLPGTDASKVTAPQYVSSAPAYVPACTAFTAATAETRIPITAAYASENIPTSQEQVDLNAWIDSLNPAWIAWDRAPLQAYYDSGAILIHHDTDGATPPGGPATAFTNHGGGGSLFDATVSGTALPISGNWMQASGSVGYPQLTTPADLVGVRLMWVMQPAVGTATYRIFGYGDVTSNHIRVPNGASLHLWSDRSGSDVSVIVATFDASSSARLFELEIIGTTATLFVNGVSVGSNSIPWETFIVDRLNRGNNATWPFEGNMGDILGVVAGQPDTAAAISAARAYLNDRFSLGLTL